MIADTDIVAEPNNPDRRYRAARFLEMLDRQLARDAAARTSDRPKDVLDAGVPLGPSCHPA